MPLRIHYYKTVDDVFVFEDGVRKSGPEASEYLGSLRRKGFDLLRLYHDLPEDWKLMQRKWKFKEGRTPDDVYYDR